MIFTSVILHSAQKNTRPLLQKAVIKSLVAYYIARPLGVMTNNVTQPKKTAPTTPFIGEYSSTFDTACQALRLFCAFSVAKGAVF